MTPRRLLVAIGIFLLGVGFCSVNYLENTEVGLTWNPLTGEKDIQQRAGWHITPPWVLETTIGTNPVRLCLTSSAHAAVNCRLVQFVPGEYRSLLEVEGFGWYWWSNRLSFNSGYSEEYRGVRDVLRGYAFSSQQYPFIHVLREYEGNQ
jgi:hypothetical protein